uniref:Uncharacterized protein n=1 Tax=mine drainage metagenome TaxID=410659 RepID=E6QVR9_9ZZZZ
MILHNPLPDLSAGVFIAKIYSKGELYV